MDNRDFGKQMNHLLSRNYDAEKGYEQVAENVKHTELKNLLTSNAQQRNRFGHELKAMMKDHNVEPDKGTSMEGDAHRAWMNVREVLSMNNDKAILDEAERGEDYAIGAYEEALQNAELRTSQREILTNHLDEIRKSKSQIDRLKETV